MSQQSNKIQKALREKICHVVEKMLGKMQLNKTADTLFKLLRIVISGAKQDIPSSVNWMEVMEMAQRQVVMAVAFEAIEHLPNDKRPDLDTLMEWLGQTSYIENQYAQQFELTKKMCAEWSAVGIRTMVFKGLAHSRYYTKPNHREFGDFDCYQFGKINEGDDIARVAGAEVDDGWYKHSKIEYKGLSVENHRYFTAVRSNRYARALNDYMVEQLGDGSYLEKLPDTEILLPTVEVEGLFMLHHSMRHFLEEGFTLRHFTDWAFWLKANGRRIVWSSFYGKCKEFGLDGFVGVMNAIVLRYLDLNVDLDLNLDLNLNKLADKVVENVLYEDSSIHNKGKGRWYERVHLITNAFRYSWKYREVAHYSMMGYLWSYVHGFIFRSEED